MAGADGGEILSGGFLSRERQESAFESGKGRMSFRKGRRPGNGHCIFLSAVFPGQQGLFCPQPILCLCLSSATRKIPHNFGHSL